MNFGVHFAIISHFLPFHSVISCFELSILLGIVILEVDNIPICYLAGKIIIIIVHANNLLICFSISFSTIFAVSLIHFNGPADGVAPSIVIVISTFLCPHYCFVNSCKSSKTILAKRH